MQVVIDKTEKLCRFVSEDGFYVSLLCLEHGYPVFGGRGDFCFERESKHASAGSESGVGRCFGLSAWVSFFCASMVSLFR